MADLKLQANRAIKVVPSDTIGIPDASSKRISSSADGTTANKLVDSAQTFTSEDIRVGSIVHNTTDGTIATITAIDSDTVLSLSADIMVSGENYVIYRNATRDVALYVGGAGNVEVITTGGETEIFAALPAGSFVPVNVRQVKAANTTATLILALS